MQHVCKYACSEEVPEPVDMEGEGFSVAFDPLDGSSIVDTNFTVGATILHVVLLSITSHARSFSVALDPPGRARPMRCGHQLHGELQTDAVHAVSHFFTVAS